MKKLIILGVVLAVSALAQTTNPLTLTLDAPNTPILPGGTGTVNMSIATASGATQPAGVQFTLNYGPEISNVTLTAGAAATAASKTLSCNTPANGQVTCVVVGLNQNTIGNGVLVSIVVTINPLVTKTSTTANLSVMLGADINGNPLTISGGTAITIGISPSSCDLNQDGKIDITDLGIVVNQAIGMQACTTGDLTKDGKCDLFDVIRIIEAADLGVCKVGP